MKGLKLCLAILSAALLAGCVCYPGGRIVINVGWRSAQAGSCTNIVNGVEGGGNPSLTIPAKVGP